MSIEKETVVLIKSVIKKSGSIELPAEGHSMYPFIQKEDICRFLLCDPPSLKRGDVVLFYSSSGQLVAHRFYGTKVMNHQVHYFLKGDTNLGFDESIKTEQIVGKLTSIQKNHKKVSVNSLPLNVWGKLVFAVPVISSLLQKVINQKIKREM